MLSQLDVLAKRLLLRASEQLLRALCQFMCRSFCLSSVLNSTTFKTRAQLNHIFAKGAYNSGGWTNTPRSSSINLNFLNNDSMWSTSKEYYIYCCDILKAETIFCLDAPTCPYKSGNLCSKGKVKWLALCMIFTPNTDQQQFHWYPFLFAYSLKKLNNSELLGEINSFACFVATNGFGKWPAKLDM